MLHLDTSIMRALPLSPAQLSLPLTPPAQIWSSPTVTWKACCLQRIYKRVKLDNRWPPDCHLNSASNFWKTQMLDQTPGALPQPVQKVLQLWCMQEIVWHTYINEWFFEEKNYSGYAQSFPVLDQPVGAWRACCNVPGPLLAPAFYFHVKNGSKAECESTWTNCNKIWTNLDKL